MSFNKCGFLNRWLIALMLIMFSVTSSYALKSVDVPGDLSGIRFKDASGKVIDLGDLQGKVVFLNFWATWCPPCRAEMPSINKLYEQFKDDKDVVFLFVDADQDLDKAQKYMDKKAYKLPVYIADSTIPSKLFRGALPTTIVFDKAGRVSYNESGAANYASSKFIAFLEKLKAN